MSDPAVSVIVVSLNRPNALCRCLMGIEQLDYQNFEVIVVSDPGGLGVLGACGFGDRIKQVAFDTPNISSARNQGLALASGEIVAFIDDDAVPEPTWLSFLTAPFDDRSVGAAGGYVIGRNGISLQYGARSVDRSGVHAPLDLANDQTQVFDPPEGGAIKTEGTNCAFRRDLLLEVGGFDPAFKFYMDETDLNLRLAKTGTKTAITPLAQVHHGFAASARRRPDRMPVSLHDIGASQVVLLRKHAENLRTGVVLDAVRAEQRARLIRHLVIGNCEPRDIGQLIGTLEAGFIDGKTRPIRQLQPRLPTSTPLLLFQSRVKFKQYRHLSGRPWFATRLRQTARQGVERGDRVTLFLFSPTTLYHRVRFTSGGFWEQTGGVFGKSDRSGRMFQPVSFRNRVAREVDRIARVRGLLCR